MLVKRKNKYNVLDFRIFNLCIPLYLLLVFLNLNFPFVFTNSVIVIFSIILLITQMTFIIREYGRAFIIVIFLLGMAAFFSYLYGTEFLKPLYLIVNFVLFIIVIRYPLKINLVKYFIYFYAAFVVYRTILSNIPIDDLFQFGSRNMVAWFIFGMTLFYYSYKIVRKEQVDLIPVFVSLFIALISNGRSAIFTTSLLTLIVLYMYLRSKRRSTKIILIVAIPILAIFLLDTYSDFFAKNLDYLQQKKLESTEREHLIQSYISHLNFETIASGVPGNIYPFSIRSGNFHNSFLLGHSLFGIFFIFFILFLVYLLLKKPKLGVAEKFLIVTLLLRSTTDTIMFVGYFDFVLFYLIHSLIVTYKKSSSYKSRLYYHQ